jgi:hypothetical protein
MTPTVLGSISLGYKFLWGSAREPLAVQLFVDADASIPVDAKHLLATLREAWPAQAPQLLLSIQSPRLLLDVLDHGNADDPWLEIPHAWLSAPTIAASIRPAHQRGLSLVWRGEATQQPEPAMASSFGKLLTSPSTDDAAQAPCAPHSFPAMPCIYQDVPSQALARQLLAQPGTWAIAGWPVADVLHGYHGQLIPPSQRTISRLLQAVDTDASLDVIENILYAEPLLPYRFLRFVNAPEHGLRHEVESVRRGLMSLGYARLKSWLQEQLPQSGDDPDLYPILTAMVTRARLMERLLDAGEENELRREVYLCGLMSQIDLLLSEPLATIVNERMPLAERTKAALLEGTGPYAPYLEIAKALESAHTRATHRLCDSHGIDMAEVNRALLRTLAASGATRHR